MNEEAILHFNKKNKIWHWHVTFKNLQVAGWAITLKKAEEKAFEVANNLPKVERINTVYNPAKDIKLAEGKIKDSFVDLTDSK